MTTMSVERPILYRDRPARDAGDPAVTTRYGRAYLTTLQTIRRSPAWRTLFATHRRDHRVLEVIEETIVQDFAYHYLVLEDPEGRVRGIQPCFLTRQDMLAGTGRGVQRLMRRVRAVLPRLGTVQTLMVGSPIGTGWLGAAPEDADWCVRALQVALLPCARRLGASLVVLKEFPAHFRPTLAPFTGDGFTRIASMPYTVLPVTFCDFDEYLQTRLSHAYRKNLRRKLRKTAQAAPIVMEVVTDITPWVHEVYPLYLQVYERSALRFEKLTPAYLCRLGQAAPDRTRFFVWRQSGHAVAFTVATLHEGALWDEYLGLSYPLALDLHLYFYTLRDLLNWCCQHGVRHYYSTPLNYDPKLHLRFDPVPIDLYVRHTSAAVNPLLRRVLPLLAPTRHDPLLRRRLGKEA